MSKIRFLVKGCECDYIFLDHINMVVSGLEGDERKLIDFTMTKLRTLVEECKLETKKSVIADAIKNLIHYKLLIATNTDISLSWVYDSDKMMDSSFKATASGVEWMELNPLD